MIAVAFQDEFASAAQQAVPTRASRSAEISSALCSATAYHCKGNASCESESLNPYIHTVCLPLIFLIGYIHLLRDGGHKALRGTPRPEFSSALTGAAPRKRPRNRVENRLSWIAPGANRPCVGRELVLRHAAGRLQISAACVAAHRIRSGNNLTKEQGVHYKPSKAITG